MTVEEMKVVITADDSKFSKAINKIKSSIASIKTGNVGKGFDQAIPKVETFATRMVKSMDKVVKKSKQASSSFRTA